MPGGSYNTFLLLVNIATFFLTDLSERFALASGYHR